MDVLCAYIRVYLSGLAALVAEQLMDVTVTCMKRWELLASYLSADTNADAGLNACFIHLNPNILYTICALVFYFSVILIFQFATSFLSAVRWDRHTL